MSRIIERLVLVLPWERMNRWDIFKVRVPSELHMDEKRMVGREDFGMIAREHPDGVIAEWRGNLELLGHYKWLEYFVPVVLTVPNENMVPELPVEVVSYRRENLTDDLWGGLYKEAYEKLVELKKGHRSSRNFSQL